MSEPIGRWLVAESKLSPSGKTLIFRVTPKDGGNPIGFIAWYSRWRRYALQPEPGTVFEADCLVALGEFCRWKTEQHREGKRRAACIELVAR